MTSFQKALPPEWLTSATSMLTHTAARRRSTASAVVTADDKGGAPCDESVPGETTADRRKNHQASQATTVAATIIQTSVSPSSACFSTRTFSSTRRWSASPDWVATGSGPA
ncbi:MAG: hypothetical protein ABIU87_09195 [Ornithinibacter sp.]